MSLTLFQSILLIVAVFLLIVIFLAAMFVFVNWIDEKITSVIARKKWEKWYHETHKEL